MRKTRIFFIALCAIAIGLSGCSPSSTNPKEEAKPSGTIQFINATYALITVDNGVDPKLFGGVEPSSANAEMMKEVLQDSWSITDAASAESTIQWLLTEGHNAEFMAYMDEYLARKDESNDIIAELKASSNPTPEEIKFTESVELFAKVHTTSPEYGIAAWDLCRATQIASWSYIAGYIPYEHAVELCIEAAEKMRERFSSWEDLIGNYLLGYQYWSEDSPSDPNSNLVRRQKIYADLLKSPDNPYSIDWNTPLNMPDKK
ncbi:DUF1266 domain-containing protein [Paenibacillus dendritiformis]|uniref:DUF1266 domain-containing protein n=1 Tax=Paenibacillus dendritiformis TaxID=130049 RepID=UPI003658A266